MPTAYLFCQMAGTDVGLVEIESDRENNFLATHARSLSADTWTIGVTDNVVEGDWVWVNSKTPLSGHYRKWLPGEPNDVHVENCAVLKASTSSWLDGACEYKHHYICEVNITIAGEFPIIG